MNDISVTMEYTGEEWPPQITKETLTALISNIGEFTLRTNMGIDLHTSEVESDATGHVYKGVKIVRL